MTRVLLVDDDPRLLRAMSINLRARGYDVRLAPDGRHALTVAANDHPDIVILDLGLPDLDGVEVIEGLRGWTNIPIIVLSGRSTGHDKVAALDAGADDYVTKPFGMDELLARLRAVVRRATAAEDMPSYVDFGPLRVDLAAKRVAAAPAAGGASGGDAAGGDASGGDKAGGASGGDASGGDKAGGEPRLTPTEWRLLEALARHPGKLVSQRQLLTEVWGPTYGDDTSSLRLYINKLRRKLEPDPARPRYLVTEPGMGYRFQP